MPDPNLEQVESNIDKSILDSEKTIQATKQTAKTLSELKVMAKNLPLGVDDETMMAFVGIRKWKLNPSGHIKSIRDEIKKNYSELITIISNQKTQLEGLNNIDKIDELSKKILTSGLDEKFNYDKCAEDIDIGPAQLRYLAQEVAHFFVVQGGKGATRQLQMLLKLEQMKLLES